MLGPPNCPTPCVCLHCHVCDRPRHQSASPAPRAWCSDQDRPRRVTRSVLSWIDTNRQASPEPVSAISGSAATSQKELALLRQSTGAMELPSPEDCSRLSPVPHCEPVHLPPSAAPPEQGRRRVLCDPQCRLWSALIDVAPLLLLAASSQLPPHVWLDVVNRPVSGRSQDARCPWPCRR
jgi:hypothetical protein